MNQSALTATTDIRTILLGLVLFIALVFALPLATVFLASLGPNEWMHTYIAPILKYKFVLIFISGICIGAISRFSPVVTAALVGFLGSIILVLINVIFASLDNQTILTSSIAWQGLKTFILCITGGLCVSLLRLIREKL